MLSGYSNQDVREQRTYELNVLREIASIPVYATDPERILKVPKRGNTRPLLLEQALGALESRGLIKAEPISPQLRWGESEAELADFYYSVTIIDPAFSKYIKRLKPNWHSKSRQLAEDGKTITIEDKRTAYLLDYMWKHRGITGGDGSVLKAPTAVLKDDVLENVNGRLLTPDAAKPSVNLRTLKRSVDDLNRLAANADIHIHFATTKSHVRLTATE